MCAIRRRLLLAGACTLGLAGFEGNAASVSDDFSTTTDNVSLIGQAGGNGWAAPWGATIPAGTTGRIKLDRDINLTYSLGGYNIVQSGTGRGYGDFNDFRGANRWIDTNLTGTVWFSILLQNNTLADHAGLQFNAHADGTDFTGPDYNRGLFDVQLSGTNVVVNYGGIDSTVGALSLALNTTHLLLGRITLQENGANDRFELWADPANLLNLGTPLYNNNTANLGTEIYLAGVFGYGSTGTVSSPQGSFDALRMSDGGGNASAAFSQVTGIPEPSTALLLGFGAVLGLAGRRRRQK
jgi:hypothetical protein